MFNWLKRRFQKPRNRQLYPQTFWIDNLTLFGNNSIIPYLSFLEKNKQVSWENKLKTIELVQQIYVENQKLLPELIAENEETIKALRAGEKLKKNYKIETKKGGIKSYHEELAWIVQELKLTTELMNKWKNKNNKLQNNKFNQSLLKIKKLVAEKQFILALDLLYDDSNEDIRKQKIHLYLYSGFSLLEKDRNSELISDWLFYFEQNKQALSLISIIDQFEKEDIKL